MVKRNMNDLLKELNGPFDKDNPITVEEVLAVIEDIKNGDEKYGKSYQWIINNIDIVIDYYDKGKTLTEISKDRYGGITSTCISAKRSKAERCIKFRVLRMRKILNPPPPSPPVKLDDYINKHDNDLGMPPRLYNVLYRIRFKYCSSLDAENNNKLNILQTARVIETYRDLHTFMCEYMNGTILKKPSGIGDKSILDLNNWFNEVFGDQLDEIDNVDTEEPVTLAQGLDSINIDDEIQWGDTCDSEIMSSIKLKPLGLRTVLTILKDPYYYTKIDKDKPVGWGHWDNEEKHSLRTYRDVSNFIKAHNNDDVTRRPRNFNKSSMIDLINWFSQFDSVFEKYNAELDKASSEYGIMIHPGEFEIFAQEIERLINCCLIKGILPKEEIRKNLTDAFNSINIGIKK